MPSEIRQRAIEARLAPESGLRAYMSSKWETARHPVAMPANSLQFFRNAYSRPLKTLLVMPPMCLPTGAVKRVIPPLGLCYVAASAESAGWQVDILDCIVEGISNEERVDEHFFRFGLPDDDFRKFLQANSYDVIGLTTIYSTDLQNLYRCAQIAKEVKPDVVVLAGGLHSSIYPRQVLMDSAQSGKNVVDFVIRGEGERRLVRFLENLQVGLVDANQDGLAGWLNGAMFVNPQYSQIEDLDSLPFPAYRKVPIEKYFKHNVPFSPYPVGFRVLPLFTSRGCPVGCTFCASTNFAKSFRARSPENVLKEVEWLKREFSVDEIQFADDNLTFDRKRTLTLMKCLEEASIPWCTPNGTMINTLDEEIIAAMKRAGLYQITLSLDSGSKKTLVERHRKPVDLGRLPALMQYIEEQEVLMHGTLVVGMPGETEGDMLEGFAYAQELPFHSMNIFIAQPVPGSELFENAIAEGRMTFQEGLMINTSRPAPGIHSIPPTVLVARIAEFLERFNKAARQRAPEMWKRKYAAHRGRMSEICIGTPDANTNAIMVADAAPQAANSESSAVACHESPEKAFLLNAAVKQ